MIKVNEGYLEFEGLHAIEPEFLYGHSVAM